MTSGQYPLLVLAHIDRLYRLTKTREHCFGNLTHLLVHSDISIRRSNNEPTIDVSSNRIKQYISLVSLRVDDVVISKSGIKLMQSLSLNTIEGPRCILLSILGLVAQLIEIDLLLSRLHLHD